MDYLGRETQTSFEAINDRMAKSNHKELTVNYDPLKITYIEHPTTKEKLHVMSEPYIVKCDLVDEGYDEHDTYCFTLEKGYKVMYCRYYKGGNWVFLK